MFSLQKISCDRRSSSIPRERRFSFVNSSFGLKRAEGLRSLKNARDFIAEKAPRMPFRKVSSPKYPKSNEKVINRCLRCVYPSRQHSYFLSSKDILANKMKTRSLCGESDVRNIFVYFMVLNILYPFELMKSSLANCLKIAE